MKMGDCPKESQFHKRWN